MLRIRIHTYFRSHFAVELDAATLNGGSGPESYLTRQRYSRLWIRILVLDGTGAPSIYG